MMTPPEPLPETGSISNAELVLLGLGVFLTLAVGTFMLVFFIRQQLSERRQRRQGGGQ
jgi:LPXTG-motif cell wall-anchored protein